MKWVSMHKIREKKNYWFNRRYETATRKKKNAAGTTNLVINEYVKMIKEQKHEKDTIRKSGDQLIHK